MSSKIRDGNLLGSILRNLANEAAEEMQKVLNRSDLYRSCVSCTHFDIHGELCKISKPNPARPPACIIADGCDWYSDDGEIPF